MASIEDQQDSYRDEILSKTQGLVDPSKTNPQLYPYLKRAARGGFEDPIFWQKAMTLFNQDEQAALKRRLDGSPFKPSYILFLGKVMHQEKY